MYKILLESPSGHIITVTEVTTILTNVNSKSPFQAKFNTWSILNLGQVALIQIITNKTPTTLIVSQNIPGRIGPLGPPRNKVEKTDAAAIAAANSPR